MLTYLYGHRAFSPHCSLYAIHQNDSWILRVYFVNTALEIDALD